MVEISNAGVWHNWRANATRRPAYQLRFISRCGHRAGVGRFVCWRGYMR